MKQKTIEDYREKVEEWVKKVQPFLLEYHPLGRSVLRLSFIHETYRKEFMKQTQKELCIWEVKSSSDTTYELLTGYNGLYAAMFLSKNEMSFVEKWFAENYPGVNPWTEP